MILTFFELWAAASFIGGGMFIVFRSAGLIGFSVRSR